MEKQLLDETDRKDSNKSPKIKKLKELIRKNFINSEMEAQLKYLREDIKNGGTDMGTVIVINRSTLTDSAAVSRVGLYLAGKKELAEVDGIHIRQIKVSGYGEKRKYLVTEECSREERL